MRLVTGPLFNYVKCSDLMISRSYNINRALTDPERVFTVPENVLSDPRLDRRIKLEILRRWRDDIRVRRALGDEVAERDAPSLSERIQRAINHLTQNGWGKHTD